MVSSLCQCSRSVFRWFAYSCMSSNGWDVFDLPRSSSVLTLETNSWKIDTLNVKQFKKYFWGSLCCCTDVSVITCQVLRAANFSETKC